MSGKVSLVGSSNFIPKKDPGNPGLLFPGSLGLYVLISLGFSVAPVTELILSPVKLELTWKITWLNPFERGLFEREGVPVTGFIDKEAAGFALVKP